MIYILRKIDGTKIYLLSGNDYVVGRKKADIVLENDASISRIHCVLKVGLGSIVLVDSSKYGTSVQGHLVETNVETNLQENDQILFGRFSNKFRVEKCETFVTTGSGLNGPQNARLIKSMEALHGKTVNVWTSECTYLTTQEIVLTIKVLQAMIDNKPIVTLEYWDKFIENLKNKLQPPSVKEYAPPLAEAMLKTVALSYKPERKELFTGRIFVFSTEQLRFKMEDLIKSTGGESISWVKAPLTQRQVEENPKKYIFITQDDKTEPSAALKQIHEIVFKRGQRTIPVQEIAMAILLCNCEKDCNPDYNRVEQVFIKPGEKRQSGMALALETQSQLPQASQNNDGIVIPGSFDPFDGFFPTYLTKPTAKTLDENIQTLNTTIPMPPSCSSSKSEPVKRANESELENSSKKLKPLESCNLVDTSSDISAKRKAEDSPEEANLSKKPTLTITSFFSKRKEKEINPDNPFAGLAVGRKKTGNSLAELMTQKPTEKDNAVSTQDNSKKVPVTPSTPYISVKKINSDNPFAGLAVERKKKGNSLAELMTQKPTEKENTISTQNHSKTAPVTPSTPYISKHGPCKWLSKSSVGDVTILTIDDELKQIYDKFKNTAVLQITPGLRRKQPLVCLEVSHNNTMVKNFKKFKKVAPLKPQTNIINASIVQRSTYNVSLVQHQEVNQRQANNFDDDDWPRPAQPKTKKSRKFTIDL